MSPFFTTDEAGWLAPRGDDAGNIYGGGNGSFQTNGTNNMMLNQFKIAAARSIRTSTIILATFNTIAAFATALGILYDSYSREKRNNRKFKFSQSGFSFVPSGEVYPLILSFAITIQGTTFAVAQSTGLKNIVTFGCTLVSQLMLPALFIVPYVQLVFAVELALRGLRKKPFAPRGKWTVTICLTTIGLFTLANFLVADFIRTPDFCFSSLFWFVARYAVGCFAVLVLVTATILICVIIVAVRLYRSIKIEVTERVCASRMVYYMALAFVSNIFMLPFFFMLAFTDQNDQTTNGMETLTLSMVGGVAASVSGLMTGGLYLFLKSNTLSTIGPKNKAGEYERQRLKHTIRIYGSADGDSDATMMRRVAGPGSLRRTNSDSSLISHEKQDEAGLDALGSPNLSSRYTNQQPNPLRSNAVYPSLRAPQTPEPAQMSASGIGHMRQRSYSLFPNNSPSTKSSVTLLPSTTYSPNMGSRARDAAAALDNLKPPPSIRNLAMGRHRRDSSMISSATVQIGLRLSSVDDMPMPGTANRTTAFEADAVSLDCPKENAKVNGKRPSPLTTSEDARPVRDESPKRNPVKDVRMKTLPPVPRLGEAIPITNNNDDDESQYTDEEEEETLSPTVYSSPSKTKLPSPKGVGFTLPPTRFNAGSPKSPPGPPPRRGTGDAPVPRAAGAKGDWI